MNVIYKVCFTCLDNTTFLNEEDIKTIMIMSKKKIEVADVTVKKNTSNNVPRCFRGAPTPNVDRTFPEPITRPGHPIGRLLALQQLDGVDGTTHNLIKSQYDESFGAVDPASDIHTDPMEFRDKLMRSGYEKVFPQIKKDVKVN